MKQLKSAVAIILGVGLALAPMAVLADHHEKAESGKKTHAEGSGGHSHEGAKKEGKAEMKKTGASEEGSAAGHDHDAQGEKEEEGSH